VNFHIILRDGDARPDAGYQPLFADQRSIGLQQGQQELERARPQLYRHTIGQQLPLTQQHRKRPNSSDASAAERFAPSNAGNAEFVISKFPVLWGFRANFPVAVGYGVP
jgi:hypothetical protein